MPPLTPEQQGIMLTLALVLTAGGAVVGQAIVAAVVQFLKSVPFIPTAGRERVWAFIVSAVLVATAYLGTTVLAQPPVAVSFLGLLAAILAWFNISRGAMAIYADVTREPNSLTGRSV